MPKFSDKIKEIIKKTNQGNTTRKVPDDILLFLENLLIEIRTIMGKERTAEYDRDEVGEALKELDDSFKERSFFKKRGRYSEKAFKGLDNSIFTDIGNKKGITDKACWISIEQKLYRQVNLLTKRKKRGISMLSLSAQAELAAAALADKTTAALETFHALKTATAKPIAEAEKSSMYIYFLESFNNVIKQIAGKKGINIENKPFTRAVLLENLKNIRKLLELPQTQNPSATLIDDIRKKINSNTDDNGPIKVTDLEDVYELIGRVAGIDEDNISLPIFGSVKNLPSEGGQNLTGFNAMVKAKERARGFIEISAANKSKVAPVAAASVVSATAVAAPSEVAAKEAAAAKDAADAKKLVELEKGAIEAAKGLAGLANSVPILPLASVPIVGTPFEAMVKVTAAEEAAAKEAAAELAELQKKAEDSMEKMASLSAGVSIRPVASATVVNVSSEEAAKEVAAKAVKETTKDDDDAAKAAADAAKAAADAEKELKETKKQLAELLAKQEKAAKEEAAKEAAAKEAAAKEAVAAAVAADSSDVPPPSDEPEESEPKTTYEDFLSGLNGILKEVAEKKNKDFKSGYEYVKENLNSLKGISIKTDEIINQILIKIGKEDEFGDIVKKGDPVKQSDVNDVFELIESANLDVNDKAFELELNEVLSEEGTPILGTTAIEIAKKKAEMPPNPPSPEIEKEEGEVDMPELLSPKSVKTKGSAAVVGAADVEGNDEPPPPPNEEDDAKKAKEEADAKKLADEVKAANEASEAAAKAAEKAQKAFEDAEAAIKAEEDAAAKKAAEKDEGTEKTPVEIEEDLKAQAAKEEEAAAAAKKASDEAATKKEADKAENEAPPPPQKQGQTAPATLAKPEQAKPSQTAQLVQITDAAVKQTQTAADLKNPNAAANAEAEAKKANRFAIVNRNNKEINERRDVIAGQLFEYRGTVAAKNTQPFEETLSKLINHKKVESPTSPTKQEKLGKYEKIITEIKNASDTDSRKDKDYASWIEANERYDAIKEQSEDDLKVATEELQKYKAIDAKRRADGFTYFDEKSIKNKIESREEEITNIRKELLALEDDLLKLNGTFDIGKKKDTLKWNKESALEFDTKINALKERLKTSQTSLAEPEAVKTDKNDLKLTTEKGSFIISSGLHRQLRKKNKIIASSLFQTPEQYYEAALNSIKNTQAELYTYYQLGKKDSIKGWIGGKLGKGSTTKEDDRRIAERQQLYQGVCFKIEPPPPQGSPAGKVELLLPNGSKVTSHYDPQKRRAQVTIEPPPSDQAILIMLDSWQALKTLNIDIPLNEKGEKCKKEELDETDIMNVFKMIAASKMRGGEPPIQADPTYVKMLSEKFPEFSKEYEKLNNTTPDQVRDIIDPPDADDPSKRSNPKSLTLEQLVLNITKGEGKALEAEKAVDVQWKKPGQKPGNN